MKTIKWTLGIMCVLIVFYLIGPKPSKPVFSTTLPVVPLSSAELEKFVDKQESKHKLKANNNARIVWADSTKQKTKYSVVYLHGFSASQGEGDPIHRQFANEFGCNLYLARMADHGIDTTEQLINFTPDRWWTSSKEALVIGKAIGENVIIMSTSTGGTMALMLAAEAPQDVFALINMSPNIAINDPLAWIANNPWGLQLARMVKGGKYNIPQAKLEVDSALNNRYWNTKYRFEAACQLQELLESKMKNETFGKIKQPCLTLYYFKDETHQDPTVKVSAILEMHKQLGTADSLKSAIPLPNVGAHVMGSPIQSKDVKGVYTEMQKFAINILKLETVN